MKEKLFDKEYLIKIVENINNNCTIANLSFRKFEVNKDGVSTIIIDGGENGSTSNKDKWVSYLSALQILCIKLEEKYNKVWVHTFNIDSIDDVWTICIGIE